MDYCYITYTSASQSHSPVTGQLRHFFCFLAAQCCNPLTGGLHYPEAPCGDVNLLQNNKTSIWHEHFGKDSEARSKTSCANTR